MKKISKTQKKKSLRTLTAVLAFVTTLSGCSLDKGEVYAFGKVVPSIQDIIDLPTDFEEEIEIPSLEEEKTIVLEDDSVSLEEEKTSENDSKENQAYSEFQQFENLVIPDLSNLDPNEVSIEDALKWANCRFDFNYRKQLASYFGIKNYTGTTEQNLLLLSYLRSFYIDFTDITYEESSNKQNSEHTHQHTWSSINDLQEKGTCDCGDEEFRNHSWENWTFVGNNTDKSDCKTCDKVIYREHVHSKIADNMYQYDHSNHDGTHVLIANYQCDGCKEDIEKFKTEDCNYDIQYTQTGINDIHLEKKDCKICGDYVEQQAACVPHGDIQYIKIYDQVYEYRECSLCYGRAERAYHVQHSYGAWEQKNSSEHERRCGCIEAYETENHNFHLEKEGNETYKTCEVCDYRDLVPEHEHDKKYNDFWDFLNHMNPMDYPDTDFNKNPTLDSFCLNLVYDCSYCGVPYIISYDHHFVSTDNVHFECDVCSFSYEAESTLKEVLTPDVSTPSDVLENSLDVYMLDQEILEEEVYTEEILDVFVSGENSEVAIEDEKSLVKVLE